VQSGGTALASCDWRQPLLRRPLLNGTPRRGSPKAERRRQMTEAASIRSSTQQGLALRSLRQRGRPGEGDDEPHGVAGQAPIPAAVGVPRRRARRRGAWEGRREVLAKAIVDVTACAAGFNRAGAPGTQSVTARCRGSRHDRGVPAPVDGGPRGGDEDDGGCPWEPSRSSKFPRSRFGSSRGVS
jgi:hypothetical protein